jgi:hypothetical protein
MPDQYQRVAEHVFFNFIKDLIDWNYFYDCKVEINFKEFKNSNTGKESISLIIHILNPT